MRKYVSVIAAGCLMISITDAAMARELTDKEKKVIAEGVKESLKDPDSAKFKWEDYKGGDVYCAYVNAKNSYGGYIGFTPYEIFLLKDKKGNIGGGVIIGMGNGNSSSTETMVIYQLCNEKGYFR